MLDITVFLFLVYFCKNDYLFKEPHILCVNHSNKCKINFIHQIKYNLVFSLVKPLVSVDNYLNSESSVCGYVRPFGRFALFRKYVSSPKKYQEFDWQLESFEIANQSSFRIESQERSAKLFLGKRQCFSCVVKKKESLLGPPKLSQRSLYFNYLIYFLDLQFLAKKYLELLLVHPIYSLLVVTNNNNYEPFNQ
ncbi:hypothetical protein PHYBLDRAFT_67612 [Phycomyces blakesleeanus NRRL 1555(-)]|uniref:Uncharacterized protein n=1 Tax=Phycomyces blakesleeanus (strain ATCC 8743b / DSM 1359 / FGSC 10004 / NBRC 33097 / NRRL 1555) TaxID=763407 RepID=A0A162UE96_PHYB8|nr:hypothetical protein PHYBLDRAFT_67612 [Phycomyces blakesleeanus NRRL 1555(-)]OAD74463.1 hypothetical protein PHYBLDRAFT_67612 [Phycomyces blakesleeanus NRRL 1555(-)]|eukprot:XP_018292503.1 hypothetical protein PHYBLDRAFT_67612 [Phycomyces blakesleeanus NRRL 1555(-)]